MSPSAFAGKSGTADEAAEPEEERREPTWPLMLITHYKSKIKEMQSIAREYALKKIVAERESFRAHDAQEYANMEAGRAREEAEAIDNGPDDTVEALQEKIMAQGPKEDAVKDEVVSSTNLLDADDRRDQAMKRQIEAMQKDLEYEQKLRNAMAEQKMRSKRRNLVPGAVAVDCSGRQIVTKDSCEAENNTVFRDGLCVVSGGENPPDSPTELALQNVERKDTEALEAAELAVNKQAKLIQPEQHEAKQAKVNLRASQQELNRVKKQLAEDTAKIPQVPSGKKLGDLTTREQNKIRAAKKLVEADEQALKDKESTLKKSQKAYDSSNAKLDDGLAGLNTKKKAEQGLRDKHIKDLERLAGEQDKLEKEDVQKIGKADSGIHQAEGKMTKAQNALATEEGDEARILREEADALKEKAERAEGPEQVDLQAEERKARLWQREAEWESAASKSGDQKTVAAENVAQKNAFWGERKAGKDARRDAYANGETEGTESVLDPNDPQYGAKKVLEDQQIGENKKMGKLTSAQKEDTEKIKGTLQAEKEAELAEINGNELKAENEEERNSTALREAETQHKLKTELEIQKRKSGPKPTSSLSVDVNGWPFQGQKLVPCMSDSNPVTLLGTAKLCRSEAPLPLGTQGALMLSLAPRHKRNFQHFL